MESLKVVKKYLCTSDLVDVTVRRTVDRENRPSNDCSILDLANLEYVHEVHTVFEIDSVPVEDATRWMNAAYKLILKQLRAFSFNWRPTAKNRLS